MISVDNQHGRSANTGLNTGIMRVYPAHALVGKLIVLFPHMLIQNVRRFVSI